MNSSLNPHNGGNSSENPESNLRSDETIYKRKELNRDFKYGPRHV